MNCFSFIIQLTFFCTNPILTAHYYLNYLVFSLTSASQWPRGQFGVFREIWTASPPIFNNRQVNVKYKRHVMCLSYHVMCRGGLSCHDKNELLLFYYPVNLFLHQPFFKKPTPSQITLGCSWQAPHNDHVVSLASSEKCEQPAPLYLLTGFSDLSAYEKTFNDTI